MNKDVENILNKSIPVFVKKLPKQKVFKEDNGEPSEVPYRLGRLNDELYRNRKVINTIYGEEEFIPEIRVYVNIITDYKGYITIDILNSETRNCIKQIIIRSQPNNMSINSLKEIYDEIVELLNDTTKEVVDLIELLRDKDIIIEEYC